MNDNLQDILGKDTAIGQSKDYLQSLILMQKAWHASDMFTKYLAENDGSGKKQVLERNTRQSFLQILMWCHRTITKKNPDVTLEAIRIMGLDEMHLLMIKHLDEDLKITKLDTQRDINMMSIKDRNKKMMNI